MIKKLLTGLSILLLVLVAGCAPTAETELDTDLDATPDTTLDTTPFVTFDSDADGLISEDEFGAGAADYDSDLVFSDLDTDADGFLNEDEFGVFEDDVGL